MTRTSDVNTANISNMSKIKSYLTINGPAELHKVVHPKFIACNS